MVGKSLGPYKVLELLGSLHRNRYARRVVARLKTCGVLVLVLTGMSCAAPQGGSEGSPSGAAGSALSEDRPVPAAELTEVERAVIERQVRARVDAFADAERRIAVEEVVSFVAPGFYMYGDGVRADYDETVAQMRAGLPTLQRFETTWSDIEVNVLSRDTAFTTMLFRDAITGGDGVTTRMRGPSTMIWKRVDGEWLIIFVDADHYPDEER